MGRNFEDFSTGRGERGFPHYRNSGDGGQGAGTFDIRAAGYGGTTSSRHDRCTETACAIREHKSDRERGALSAFGAFDNSTRTRR